MHMLQAFHKLAEIVTGLRLSESPAKSDEVEQLASTNQLKNDEAHLFTAFLWVNLVALTDLYKPDNVPVVHLSKHIQLCVDALLQCLGALHQFDRVPRARAVSRKLDFARDSTAESPAQLIPIVKNNWHKGFVNL